MRVLLSAYACEPHKGSEAEIGWQRSLHMLAFADEVWVLTRSNNQPVIEADPLSHSPRLHFIYFDLPGWALKLKKKSWFPPIYFILWQWGAYRLAVARHRDKPFDCVYHVTFASMRSGSFMGRLGIPFVIGPIGGGERAPSRLRHSLSRRSKADELLRDFGILVQRSSPLALPAYAAAKRIYVTTPESLRLVPSRWHSKTAVHLAIAAYEKSECGDERRLPKIPRFVFAGRLVQWKGVHLAIRALAEARRTVPAASLTLIGNGPDERQFRETAKRFGVADAVEFVGHLPRQQLADALRGYTALVFPSLHDSGGFVVLEALAEGLPVVCLDLGGPGVIVNESCGIVVPAKDADEAQTVTGIANAMILLAAMPSSESKRLSMGAIARSSELSWAEMTKCIASSASLS
jgi:glycosyltransferase involved in cell wall biosynthesis